ncbi:MAG: hypothetical protein ACI37Q_03615 [Candidatus Gastranaerophilaceae bacterium]
MTKNNNHFDIEYLEYKIKQAQEHNEPIDNYILREISWLQQQLDIFLEKSKQEGKDIETDFDIAEIEIRQYAAMKQLAQKINHPCDIYDEKIKQVQVRIFGEKNWENFFGK